MTLIAIIHYWNNCYPIKLPTRFQDIGNCLRAADYHAARGERQDFDFWSAKADEIADMYREYGAPIHAQYQARF